MLRPPQSRMDILSETEMDALVSKSKIAAKYNKMVDSESAYEILNEKLKAAAEKKEEQTSEEKKPAKSEKGFFDDPVIRSMTRTAGNTIVRSLLGVLGVSGSSRRRKSLF
jgi:hypothetical protein